MIARVLRSARSDGRAERWIVQQAVHGPIQDRDRQRVQIGNVREDTRLEELHVGLFVDRAVLEHRAPGLIEDLHRHVDARRPADDHVGVELPHHEGELERRLSAGREQAAGTEAFDECVGDLVLDLDSHEAVKAGQPIQLTRLEFRIIFMLAMSVNRVVPHSRLVEYAWGYESGDVNLLKTHICHLREKLGMPVDANDGIKAIPGVGYRLVI